MISQTKEKIIYKPYGVHKVYVNASNSLWTNNLSIHHVIFSKVT